MELETGDRIPLLGKDTPAGISTVILIWRMATKVIEHFYPFWTEAAVHSGKSSPSSPQSTLYELLVKMGSGHSTSSRILVLGIDGAGKTSFLNKYENPGGAEVDVQPTDGFIVKDVKVKGVKLNVWDVAGKEATRSLWKHYYEQGHTDAIIWVVDAADSEERLEESRNALQGALLDPHLQGMYFKRDSLQALEASLAKASATLSKASLGFQTTDLPKLSTHPVFTTTRMHYRHTFIALGSLVGPISPHHDSSSFATRLMVSADLLRASPTLLGDDWTPFSLRRTTGLPHIARETHKRAKTRLANSSGYLKVPRDIF
jgi:hypothetical protein